MRTRSNCSFCVLQTRIQKGQKNGASGNSWNIEDLSVGDDLEVKWEGHFYHCSGLQVDVERAKVFVTWAGGNTSQNCWVAFSSTRAPGLKGKKGKAKSKVKWLKGKKGKAKSKVKSLPAAVSLLVPLLKPLTPMLFSSFLFYSWSPCSYSHSGATC
jgi:hypothetical protein